MITRRNTYRVWVRGIPLGGCAPISIQSMTSCDTRDIDATVHQIERLVAAGCDIVRLAVLNSEAAAALYEIRRRTNAALVADIHFDHRHALTALDAGFDKLRLNPGNIGDAKRVRQVALAAKEAKVPIRIGVNAASLEKDILAKHGGVTADAMVESALGHIRLLEEAGFSDIVIALKAPDIERTVQSYRLMAEGCEYPLHLGITHAGLPAKGIVLSAVGLGILLAEGIGDTIRVSLTGDPVAEVTAAKSILEALNLRPATVNLVSCPTCGRCQIDLLLLATAIEDMLAEYKGKPITVAVMGCEVNGPGEAREADIGIAAGQGSALIFCKGEVIKKVEVQDFPDGLLRAFAETMAEMQDRS